MRLYDYLKRIERVYKLHGERYAALVADLKDTKQAIKRTMDNKDLSESGRQKQVDHFRERLDEIKAELAAISATADRDAADVRNEIEADFYARFHPTPDAVDERAMRLLEAGVLSDSELRHMAGDYRENLTMSRIVGSYLLKSASEDNKKLGRMLTESVGDPHLRAADKMIELGRYCVGCAPLSGPEGAPAMLRHFDDMAASIYREAPDV